MQAIRFIGMVAAVAGILFVLNHLPGSIGMWIIAALLVVGFLGLFNSYRIVKKRSRPARKRSSARKK